MQSLFDENLLGEQSTIQAEKDISPHPEPHFAKTQPIRFELLAAPPLIVSVPKKEISIVNAFVEPGYRRLQGSGFRHMPEI
jgi:hypothetical protein